MSSPQPLVVGINFGTSNSAAALIDANGVLQVIPLDGDKAEQHTVLYGSEAMRAFQGLILIRIRSYINNPLPIAN